MLSVVEIIRHTESDLRHRRIALIRELERARETRPIEDIERDLDGVEFLLGGFDEQ